jgi:hypothetical protein
MRGSFHYLFVINMAQDCKGQGRRVGLRKCLTLLAPILVEVVPMNTQPSSLMNDMNPPLWAQHRCLR